MKTDFTYALADIDTMNNHFHWQKGYQEFWDQLSNGTLDDESFQLLMKDLSYFYSRYIEFFSSVLHRNLRSDVMFPLSANFVQALKINLAKIPDIHLNILPGMESICNHMLMTAETDYFSFFLSMYTLNQLIFEKEEFKKVIERHDNKELNKFLSQLPNSTKTLHQIKEYFYSLDKVDLQRVQNNNYTLCETIDFWFEEVLTKYNKSMISIG